MLFSTGFADSVVVIANNACLFCIHSEGVELIKDRILIWNVVSSYYVILEVLNVLFVASSRIQQRRRMPFWHLQMMQFFQ